MMHMGWARKLGRGKAPLLLALIGWVAPLSSAATIYNAVNDFSLSGNPNGVWSYGSMPGTGGSFSAFVVSAAGATFEYWLNQPFSEGFPDYFPWVARNVSGSTFTNTTGLTVPTDVLYMHPGINLLSIVQFTAATTGQHVFTGSFLGLQQPFDRGGGFGSAPGPTVDVSAWLNGTTALIAPTALQAPSGSSGGDVLINLVLNLTAGDTVQFRVDPTQVFTNQVGRSDLDIQGDSIGLRLLVNAPSQPQPEPIPEPSTLVLVSLALGVLFYRLRFVR